jgi:hypothetical protein
MGSPIPQLAPELGVSSRPDLIYHELVERFDEISRCGVITNDLTAPQSTVVLVFSVPGLQRFAGIHAPRDVGI